MSSDIRTDEHTSIPHRPHQRLGRRPPLVTAHSDGARQVRQMAVDRDDRAAPSHTAATRLLVPRPIVTTSDAVRSPLRLMDDAHGRPGLFTPAIPLPGGY